MKKLKIIKEKFLISPSGDKNRGKLLIDVNRT